MKFSILITTKNRLADLITSLDSLQSIISRDDVEIIICDDASTDGTANYIAIHYPKIHLIKNQFSKGYLVNRNMMLNITKAQYAISLDDDANFLSENPLEAIESYFIENANCGLIAFRIFWGRQKPNSIHSQDKAERVKSYVGGGHVWRIAAWRYIPNYPEWFEFYGEEDFASFEVHKKNIEVHYLPSVLVHHRVDLLERKYYRDYQWRMRRSYSSGWYLFCLFYPLQFLPKRFFYSIWIQLKTKTFKGDVLATLALFQAMFDVILNLPKLVKYSSRFTKNEFENYLKITEPKIFWKPNE